MRIGVYGAKPEAHNPMPSLLFLLLLGSALTGCALLSPRTAALQAVHQAYREEFGRAVALPAPSEGPRPVSDQKSGGDPAFPATLRAIREFKVTYGEDSREAAHLTVLEGMIYLQSGRFGMAKLVADDVAAAQSSLRSGTGQYTRDELLAKTFGYLVLGWQEIHDFTDASDSTIAEHAKLAQAADGIKTALDGLGSSKLAQPEVDEGAIYLATTAAIFYVWSFALKNQAGLPDARKDIWFTKGHELIGRYLSDSERKAAVGTLQPGEAQASNAPIGRLRYVEWYGYLLGAAQ
jgi:hypothetical protein